MIKKKYSTSHGFKQEKHFLKSTSRKRIFLVATKLKYSALILTWIGVRVRNQRGEANVPQTSKASYLCFFTLDEKSCLFLKNNSRQLILCFFSGLAWTSASHHCKVSPLTRIEGRDMISEIKTHKNCLQNFSIGVIIFCSLRLTAYRDRNRRTVIALCFWLDPICWDELQPRIPRESTTIRELMLQSHLFELWRQSKRYL